MGCRGKEARWLLTEYFQECFNILNGIQRPLLVCFGRAKTRAGGTCCDTEQVVQNNMDNEQKKT